MSNNPGAPDLRVAMETRLVAISNPLSTQWENVTFVPVANVPYQNVNFLYAKPTNPEMGRYYQSSGYMQVTLRYPAGVGSKDIEAAAQALQDWFYKGLSLAANGLTVTVNGTPARGATFNDGDRFCVPVKIPFFANIAL